MFAKFLRRGQCDSAKSSSYEYGHCLISISRREHIIVKMLTDHCLNKYILNRVTFK
jgi:hypothetical protein